ncbi:MAG TPA: hypothetical protein DCO79_15535 [Spirochaeta sp.]|nr:hypothetical protein [Spirochaeta sp.]
MKSGIMSENQLKSAAGGKLDKLIDIWHGDVNDRCSKRVDIVLGNRRDNSSPVRGGILTSAVIEMNDENTRLMIWYDPLELYYEARISEIGYSSLVIDEITEMLKEDRDPGAEWDPVSNPDKLDIGTIAGQIGRWLMRFRGYKKLGNENKNFFELESYLNHECGIPALYSIFDEAGFDRSGIEQKRLLEVYEGLRNMEEPSRRVDRALNALRVSNILEFSPDSEEKRGLEELLNTRFGKIMKINKDIGELKNSGDLTKAEGLNSFMRKLVLKYRLPGSWVSVDETV